MTNKLLAKLKEAFAKPNSQAQTTVQPVNQEEHAHDHECACGGACGEGCCH